MSESDLKILNIEDSCTGCGACVSACPRSALEIKYGELGFYYPALDEEKCINCRLCERVCHVLKAEATSKIDRGYTPYMLKAKDKEIVAKSSSGGAFSLLANTVLNKKGVVYGARYNYEKERLEHVSTDNCELSELRKSKYIESYTGKVFADVRAQLRAGRFVLFVGTPCQVRGLHTYLTVKKCEISKLITARFVCHGVPANKFFTEYKNYRERRHKSGIKAIDFRPKTRGWEKSSLKLEFENGQIIDTNWASDYYYSFFYYDLMLRKSCYQCSLVNETGGADFTLADFWGLRAYKPTANAIEGCSLLLVHSEKGNSMLPDITNHCEMEKLPLSAVDYLHGGNRISLLERRNRIAELVQKYGYMSTAKRVLWKKILWDAGKDVLRRVIKRVKLIFVNNNAI